MAGGPRLCLLACILIRDLQGSGKKRKIGSQPRETQGRVERGTAPPKLAPSQSPYLVAENSNDPLRILAASELEPNKAENHIGPTRSVFTGWDWGDGTPGSPFPGRHW